MNMVGAGYYQCYCKNFSSTEAFFNSVTSSADEEGVEVIEDIESKTAELCYDYTKD